MPIVCPPRVVLTDGSAAMVRQPLGGWFRLPPLPMILSAPAEAATAMTADAPVHGRSMHGRASCAMSLELATIYVSGARFAR